MDYLDLSGIGLMNFIVTRHNWGGIESVENPVYRNFPLVFGYQDYDHEQLVHMLPEALVTGEIEGGGLAYYHPLFGDIYFGGASPLGSFNPEDVEQAVSLSKRKYSVVKNITIFPANQEGEEMMRAVEEQFRPAMKHYREAVR